MSALTIVLLALAPCIFWLWLIYRWDKYKPEPKRLIIRTFFFGMLIAIPASLIETVMYPNANPTTLQGPLSLPLAAYLGFGVAGLVEESCKYFVVRRTVYKSAHFEEPADGLIYASAAALGFASLENVGYMLAFGWQVILVRGMFSNLIHVLASSLWGYPLSLNKLGMAKKSLVWSGLVAAMLVHGAFDFLFFTQSAFTWLVVPLFIGMVVFFVLAMRHANRHSVYIEHRVQP